MNLHVFAATSASNFEDLRAAKAGLSQRFLQSPIRASAAVGRALTAGGTPDPERNVQGVGIGEKIVNGKATGVLAIKLFVRMKFPESEIGSGLVLPKVVGGIPTDVEETGLFRKITQKRASTALQLAEPRDSAQRRRKKRHPQPSAPAQIPDPRKRYRPAPPGSSIGFRDPNDGFRMAGTFGAVVRRGSSTCILSNNHVLADENRLPKGSSIFQPGLLDGGSVSKDQIATLSDFVQLTAAGTNKVDAAIAQAASKDVTNAVLMIGPPKGTVEAAVDMIVHKFGRTTSYTAGRITSIETDVNVGYDIGTLTFENQIIIVGLDQHPFSAAGDSGSLILERSTNRAVGLLFAGSSSHTIANHIEEVLNSLQVTLV